jgi:cytochrome c peroxidase
MMSAVLFVAIFVAGEATWGGDNGLSAQHLKLAPLPSIPIPANNPITSEKTSLGKQLFFDPRLSKNSTMSCATCHNPGLGYGDGLPRAIGYMGVELGRNTPSLYTTAYQNLWFWDGRARSLEEQVLMPIQAPGEMNQNLPGLLAKLRGIPGYVQQFRRAFGDLPISQENMAKAIATFLRTIVPGESPFDKYLKGDRSALSTSAQRGLELFQGKARCILCHNGPNLTDDGFHNIGVPPAGPPKEDLGRYRLVPLAALKGAFKTPSLRMVALTAPYMHNGVHATLEEVIEFYDRGGDMKENLAAEMRPLNLIVQEKRDLKAFLLGLTGAEMPVVFTKLPPIGANGGIE